MLSSLAIWYLRFRKRSVLIGYELEGGLVKCKNNTAYIYDNKLENVDYRCNNDKPFNVPEGRFNEEIH